MNRSLRRVSIRASLIVVAIICVALAADKAVTTKANRICKSINDRAPDEMANLYQEVGDARYFETVVCVVDTPSLLDRVLLKRVLTVSHSWKTKGLSSGVIRVIGSARFKITSVGRERLPEANLNIY